MPRSISVKQNGVFKNVVQAYVQQNGVWKSPTEIYIKQNGVWKLVYPEEAGSIAYTTPGTYSFTVPNGITRLTCTVVGAGGGGGGLWNPGDAWSGAGGGSGGFYLNSIATVTPGQILTITVGAGGLGGSGLATGYWYPCSGLGNTFLGQSGGSSSVGALLVATGGSGAGNPIAGQSAGAGGSPNGVAGQGGVVNCLTALYGGDNGTGYGKGGDGGNCVNTGYCAASGGNGFVSISW